MKRSARLSTLVIGAALSAGCATLRDKVLHGVGPDYQRPSVSSPEEFRGMLGPPDAASLADLPRGEYLAIRYCRA
jgi:hypothetical protein